MAHAVKRRRPTHQQLNGKPLLPSHKLQCFSVACLDMPHLEFGDKAVLPPVKILLELQCSKIATPFQFTVRAAGANSTEGDNLQYCSVQEFSAPEGHVFLPYWLMQNLHVPEGGSVVISCVTDLPRGIYCRLQPETTTFLDLAAEVGPKLLMETALRRYSVLSVNSTIVIEYGSVRFYVRVAELKPAAVVSLCGDVDLETDFMPPEGSDLKRPLTAKSSRSSDPDIIQQSHSGPPSVADCSAAPPRTSSTPESCYGRRLRDGGYVESSLATSDVNTQATQNAPRKITFRSLQQAQQFFRDRKAMAISTVAIAAAVNSSVLAAQLRLAQGPFSTPGYALGSAQSIGHTATPVDADKSKPEVHNNKANTSDTKQAGHPDPTTQQDGVQRCRLCLADVSEMNMEIHTLRCAKNPAYHKFECFICHEKILLANEEEHQHCPECTLLCGSRELVAEHQRNEHSASCKCRVCGALFTRTDLQDHVDNRRCDHTLAPCTLCGLAFEKKDMAQHFSMCSSRTECCDVCKAYVKITEFHAHQQQCEAVKLQGDPVLRTSGSSYATTRPPYRAEISNQTIECVYCFQGGFPSIADVEHHVLSDCRVAKSFAIPETPPSNNQEEADPPSAATSDCTKALQDNTATRPLLAQGRLRRKGDTSALHRQSSPAQWRTVDNNQLNHFPTTTDQLLRRSATSFLGPSTLLPPTSRPLQQAGKLGKPKPKPRPNPHLGSLPQRVSKPASALQGPRSSSSSGPAELCISTAGGTSHRAVPPQPRSQSYSRVRRRPVASGRLDKLP